MSTCLFAIKKDTEHVISRVSLKEFEKRVTDTINAGAGDRAAGGGAGGAGGPPLSAVRLQEELPADRVPALAPGALHEG